MKKPGLKPRSRTATGNQSPPQIEKDIAAMTNLYDDNAVLMPQSEEAVLGKAAIGEYYKKLFANPDFVPFTLKSDWNSFQLAGDIAIAASVFEGDATRQREAHPFPRKGPACLEETVRRFVENLPQYSRRDPSQEIICVTVPSVLISQLSTINSPSRHWSLTPKEESSMKSTTISLATIAVLCVGIAPLSRAADQPFIGKWKLNLSKSKLADQMTIAPAGANRYTLTFAGDRRHRDPGGGRHRPARNSWQHHFHYG